MRTGTAARSTPLVGAPALIVLLLTVTAACGDDHTSAGERYCTAIKSHLVALESPAIATAADINATLELYHSIADGAPVAVQPEWQTVAENLETAATVDPKDPESLQRAADTARRSNAAAVQIQQYTQQNCGIDIGTPPPTTNPVTATTLVSPNQPVETTGD